MTFMTTAAVIGTAVGANTLLGDPLGLGGKGGDQYRGQADAANAASARYYDQLATMSGEQWDIWKKEGLPLLKELGDKRNLNEDEYTSRAADDVKSQFATQRANMERNLGRYRNPGDPGYGALLAPSYMDEAAQTAGAISNARRYVNETNWNRTAQVQGMYAGFPASSASGFNAAGTGAIRSAANYGAMGESADTRAAQTAYAGFNLAGNASRWFGGRNPAGQQGAIPSFEQMNQGNYNFNPSIDPYSADYLPAGDYSGGFAGGGAIPRRTRYADGGKPTGGMIKGPGTGTSDSVPMRSRPGSFILSADTVRAIGEKKVRDFIEAAGVRPGQGGTSYSGIPIRASNGEAEIPPEAVSFHGEDFFNKLQQKYHRPTMSDDGMANGGVIRKRGLPHSVEEAIFHAMPSRAIAHQRRG